MSWKSDEDRIIRALGGDSTGLGVSNAKVSRGAEAPATAGNSATVQLEAITPIVDGSGSPFLFSVTLSAPSRDDLVDLVDSTIEALHAFSVTGSNEERLEDGKWQVVLSLTN